LNTQLNVLTATQVTEYRNRTGVKLPEVKFHIYANAYREGALFPPVQSTEIERAFPNGRSFGNITFARVSVDGVGVDIIIGGEDENVLIVPMAGGLQPNQTVSIEKQYTVRLANIAHRLGYTERVVNLGNFYPMPVIFQNGGWVTYPYSFNGDPFFNDLHNYEVTIRFNKDLIIASSGSLVNSRLDGNMRVNTFRSTAIRDFAMVLSRYFQSITRVVDKVVLSYFWINDDEPERSFQTAVDSMRTFSRLFIPYPYKQLTVVQTDFLHGGMEYGELVMVAYDVLNGENASRQFHDQVIIHEIAHQWWYGIIGNNQFATSWIDEGLAEYSTLLFYSLNPQYGIDVNMMIANARDSFAFYSQLLRSIGAEVNPNMNLCLNSFRSSYDYVFMAYVRGLLLFVDLERLIGQEKMKRALQKYARAHAFGFSTKDNLIASFEKTTRTELRLFFETFLIGGDLTM